MDAVFSIPLTVLYNNFFRLFLYVEMKDNACSVPGMQSIFLEILDIQDKKILDIQETCTPGFLLGKLKRRTYVLFCSENYMIFISEEVSLTPNFQVKEQLVFPSVLNAEWGVFHNYFL